MNRSVVKLLMDVRPLIFVDVSSLSGGVKRIFNVLKRGKTHGIDYVVVFNRRNYENALRYFPFFDKIMSQYRFYMLDWPTIYGNTLPVRYKNLIKLAKITAEIAKKENVDLIVSPSETHSKFLLSYLTGLLSSKPWTVIFQSTPIIGLNLKFRHPYSALEQLWTFFTYLKISERTLMLAVSKSIQNDLKKINSKINIYVIEPGCGVECMPLKTCDTAEVYDAIFSARLIPEKGLYDILEIWNLVTRQKPDAKLLVIGMTESKKHIEKFHSLIKRYKLGGNIIFLGEKNDEEVFHLLNSSKLLVYPSVLDSFPLSVLEALACGKPVIAYNIPAIQLNYGGCKAVKTVKVKDNANMAKCILSLLENETERAILSYDAKSFAQKCSWDRVVEAEKEAYTKVLYYP